MFKKILPQTTITHPEKIIYLLMLICAVTGFILQFINKLTLNFPVTNVPFYHPFLTILCGVTLLAGAHYLKPTMHRTFLIIFSFAMSLLAVVVTSWLAVGIESTPFPLVDSYLLAIDEFLYFYTLPIMTWTFQHPLFHKLLVFSYAFVLTQVLLMPLLLAVLDKKKAVYEFFILLFISFIVTAGLYFLFPANGPYAILHSSLFPRPSTLVVTQFYDIHHYIVPGGSFIGIISFPSLHIFWILILMYVVREMKWLFIPVFIINALAFLSTLLLGWHYLVDVLASTVLFYLVFIPVLKKYYLS